MVEPAKPETGGDEPASRHPRTSRALWIVVGAAGVIVMGAVLLYVSSQGPSNPSPPAPTVAPTPKPRPQPNPAELISDAEPVNTAPTSTPARALCGPMALECPENFVCTSDGVCARDDMVAVPEGPFQMGCNAGGTACNRDELPYRTVKISTFAIDRTEVTVAAYRKCMEAGVCTAPQNRMGSRQCNTDLPGHDEHPVNCVSWNQASRYCLWSMKRLPTEAEWEKAARGIDGRRYPWGDDPPTCNKANLFIDDHQCRHGTEPVGSHAEGSSPYGALDMVGNVLEWVSDYYDVHAYFLSDDVDPRGPPTGDDRVLRGGSFGDASDVGHHVWIRYHLPPETTGQHIGFRCAADL